MSHEPEIGVPNCLFGLLERRKTPSFLANRFMFRDVTVRLPRPNCLPNPNFRDQFACLLRNASVSPLLRRRDASILGVMARRHLASRKTNST